MHQWVVQGTGPAAGDTGHHPNAKGGAQYPPTHTPHVHDTQQVCDTGLDLVYEGHLDDSYGAWLHAVYHQLRAAAHPPEPPRAICKHSGNTSCGRWSRCEYPTCTMTDDDDQ